MKRMWTLLLLPFFLIVTPLNAQSSRLADSGEQAKAAALEGTVDRQSNPSPGTGAAAACCKNGASCCKVPSTAATVQGTGSSNSPEAGNNVAQRAACSSAFSKAKANSRKMSIPVKLVSNWQ